MRQGIRPFSVVRDRVYTTTLPFLAETGPAEVTVGLVLGTEAALLVDAGATPTHGRSLRAAVAELTRLPVAAVVLTHWHYDHAFGHVGAGAQMSIAHESVPERLASTEAAAEAVRLGVDPDEILEPNRTVAVATAIDLGGGVRVEVVHLGRGHTDGDLVAVVPGFDVVFAGDLVESSGPPQLGSDSFLHEWPATLDGLIGLTTEKTAVIPGHGAALDREAVFEQRGRVASVSGEISRLAGLGVRVEEAEARGDWALPFDAIRPGLAAGLAQARGTSPIRRLPLV